MIFGWLLLAHLVGDYLLQTRWQAAGKFGWTKRAMILRATHCWSYGTPFILLAYVYADGWWSFAFWNLLIVGHFFTDAQRFTSTPGDWIAWRWFLSPAERADAYERVERFNNEGDVTLTSRPADDVERKLKLKPNPWPSIPLAIDQTLHLAQILILAQVFLR